jgi:hypothetical protein
VGRLGLDGKRLTPESAKGATLAVYERGLEIAGQPGVARAMVNSEGKPVRVDCIMQVGRVEGGCGGVGGM